MSMSELSTSSGRLTLLTQIGTVIAAGMAFIPAVLAVKIVAILTAVYVFYRTVLPALQALVKITPTTKDDTALAELQADVAALTAKFGTPTTPAVTLSVSQTVPPAAQPQAPPKP